MDPLLEATRRAEQDHFWFRGFRAFVAPLVAQALAGRAAPEILDCGCGTGANLLMLGAHGRASGFDYSWRGLKFAQEYGVRRVAHASITDIPFPTDRFDLVTVFDVIYAVPREATSVALREVWRVVKPGGHAIFNTAALPILRGHHSMFGFEVQRGTRRSFQDDLQGAGFEIVRLTYTNFSLFPLMLAVRAVQRLMGPPTRRNVSADLSVPIAPLNTALTALLMLEAKALKVADMPIGSSLLCLVRKPVR